MVGLSTGLTTNKQSSNEYPESVPLTAACRFCFGSDEVPSGLDYSIASITPGKMCRRLYNDMQNLTNSDYNCTRAQALAALRCGCLQFPPTPTNPTCSLYREGCIPSPFDTSFSADYFLRTDRWLQTAGQDLEPNECDDLRFRYNEWRCIPEIHNDDECFADLMQIAFLEIAVTDLTAPRVYVVCPDTEFVTGQYLAACRTELMPWVILRAEVCPCF